MGTYRSDVFTQWWNRHWLCNNAEVGGNECMQSALVCDWQQWFYSRSLQNRAISDRKISSLMELNSHNNCYKCSRNNTEQTNYFQVLVDWQHLMKCPVSQQKHKNATLFLLILQHHESMTINDGQIQIVIPFKSRYEPFWCFDLEC